MRRQDRLANEISDLKDEGTINGLRTRPWRGALFIAGVLVVLAGCGEGDGDAGGAGDSPSSSREAASTAPSESTPEETAEAPDLRVAVIGDSIPYGGADCGGCMAFVDLYAAELGKQSGQLVEANNLSTHDGLTSPQLLTRIKTDDYYRDAVAITDILIVSTGHNDTPWAVTDDPCDGDSGDNPVWVKYQEPCLTKTAEKQAGDLTKFLTEARKLRAGKPTVQIVTTVYNDWIGWSDAPAAATQPSAATLDAFYKSECAAAKRVGAVCLDNYHAFNGSDGLTPAGDLLGPDYTHPSQKGHDLFARMLMDVDVTTVAGP